MTIASEITRINNNIASSYSAAAAKGALLPTAKNSNNLAATISTITTGGGGTLPEYPTAQEVYEATRPQGSIELTPDDTFPENTVEMILEVAQNESSGIAFSLNGFYDVWVYNASGALIDSSIQTPGFRGTYNWTQGTGETSEGNRQFKIVAKPNGNNLTAFTVGYGDASSYRNWNIIEIKALPASSMSFSGLANLKNLKYFNLVTKAGRTSSISGMSATFQDCAALLAILGLGTASSGSWANAFNGCSSLMALPDSIDFSTATNLNNCFNTCYSLKKAPNVNSSSATNLSNTFANCYNLEVVPMLDCTAATSMNGTFNNCYRLKQLPLLSSPSNVTITTMNNMFANCYNLEEIPDWGTATGLHSGTMTGTFNNCYKLKKTPTINPASWTNLGSTTNIFGACKNLKQIIFNPNALWNPTSSITISLGAYNMARQDIVSLFNSLPTLGSGHGTVTLSFVEPIGFQNLTTADKNIAINKGYTLSF